MKTFNQLTEQELELIRSIPITHVLNIRAPTNRPHKICCPIHNEKTPSFTIYPDGSFFCYGCNVGGNNAIDLLTKMGLSFKEAVEEILKYVI